MKFRLPQRVRLAMTEGRELKIIPIMNIINKLLSKYLPGQPKAGKVANGRFSRLRRRHVEKLSKNNLPGWRNWQTHYLEVVAPARAWGFKSPLGHHSTRFPSWKLAHGLWPNGRISLWALNSAARVLPLHGRSRGFESLSAHHSTRFSNYQ